MVAARIGKDGYIRQIAGYCTDENDTRVRQVSWAIFEVSWGKTKDRYTEEIVDLTRARMKMTRVCVFHVGQKYASDSPGIVGECIAIMAWECARYQVDVIAGDGNKACYYTTPKSPGVPRYQHSLLQFWISRMMGVATQAMRKNHDRTCPPTRVKHFISCSYRDLDFLATHLDGITTATYTEEHMKKTDGKGDCCMLSVVEWGHSRLENEECLSDFDDEDHMNYVGEFYFKVNETCLHGDHNICMVAPNDRDAHNPILVHLDPSDMSWNERHHYQLTHSLTLTPSLPPSLPPWEALYSFSRSAHSLTHSLTHSPVHQHTYTHTQTHPPSPLHHSYTSSSLLAFLWSV